MDDITISEIIARSNFFNNKIGGVKRIAHDPSTSFKRVLTTGNYILDISTDMIEDQQRGNLSNEKIKALVDKLS